MHAHNHGLSGVYTLVFGIIDYSASGMIEVNATQICTNNSQYTGILPILSTGFGRYISM